MGCNFKVTHVCLCPPITLITKPENNNNDPNIPNFVQVELYGELAYCCKHTGLDEGVAGEYKTNLTLAEERLIMGQKGESPLNNRDPSFKITTIFFGGASGN